MKTNKYFLLITICVLSDAFPQEIYPPILSITDNRYGGAIDRQKNMTDPSIVADVNLTTVTIEQKKFSFEFFNEICYNSRD